MSSVPKPTLWLPSYFFITTVGSYGGFKGYARCLACGLKCTKSAAPMRDHLRQCGKAAKDERVMTWLNACEDDEELSSTSLDVPTSTAHPEHDVKPAEHQNDPTERLGVVSVSLNLYIFLWHNVELVYSLVWAKACPPPTIVFTRRPLHAETYD